jgi:hypothetical protein
MTEPTRVSRYLNPDVGATNFRPRYLVFQATPRRIKIHQQMKVTHAPV